MVDLMGGIASATAVISLAKDVKTAIDKVADAETKIQMAELISKLADLKMEAADQLGRIAEMEEKLSLKEKMAYEAPYYWLKNNNDMKDGPFCQKCYDSDQKAIRLQSNGGGSWSCCTCRNGYTDDDYTPPDFTGAGLW